MANPAYMGLAGSLASRPGRKDAYIQQPRGGGGITSMLGSAKPIGTPYDGGPQAGGAGWIASGRKSPPMGGGMTPPSPVGQQQYQTAIQQLMGGSGQPSPSPAPPMSPGYGDMSWLGGQNYGAPQPMPPQPVSQGYSGARPTLGGMGSAQLGPPIGMQVPPFGPPQKPMAKPFGDPMQGGGPITPLEDYARPMPLRRPPGY